MKKYLKGKYILIFIIAFLGFGQLIKIDKTNPVVNSQEDFLLQEMPTQEIATLVKNLCFDCHSNETKYPWYADYAPVSWWVKSHVNEAREELNFSEWGFLPPEEKTHKALECAEAIERGEMPVVAYTWMHESAKVSEGDLQKLADWFKLIAQQ